jgi:hypothetical protein
MRRVAIFGAVLGAAAMLSANASADGVSRKTIVRGKAAHHRVHRHKARVVVEHWVPPVVVAVAPPPVPVPRPDYGWQPVGSGWPGIPESAQDRLWTAYFRSPAATGYPVGNRPETVGEVRYNPGAGPVAPNPPPISPDRIRIAVAPALFQYDGATGEYVRLAVPDASLAAATVAAHSMPPPIPLVPPR